MKSLITSVFLCFSLWSFSQLQVTDLRVEQLINPIGLDIAKPNFSWKLVSSQKNTMQTSYELTVASAADFNPKSLTWKTKVNTDQSVYVPYMGPTLVSNMRYFWKVTITDNHSNSATSAMGSYFHTGLLQPTEWTASWISPPPSADTVNRPSPVLRRVFQLKKDIKSATLFISARGLYEAMINGQSVGKDYLTPGWTAYQSRIQYQAYDVTPLLIKGDNAMGATLGNGWYRGEIGFVKSNNLYGKEISLISQLHVSFKDGTSAIIQSDKDWYSNTGPILSSEIYHGETYDARKELPGWSKVDYNATSWTPVEIKDLPKNLISTYNEPVRKRERIKAVKLIVTPKGEQVIDFGQNMVGWVEVKAQGPAGTKLEIQHAEVLDKFGNFYIDNLRRAKQTNVFILKGAGQESFEPHFTFQGFRYIKLTGFPSNINIDNFTGIALYSDMALTGHFECSNPLINQLQHNIQWGQRGNFVDVPTDCPQRDERLGWTGDAQAFARTAAFNFGVQNFFAKWLQDVAADQRPNGSVPFVIPNVLGANAGGSAGWADAATIIPWNMFLLYGDTALLNRQYPSMKKWVKYMTDSSRQNLWNKGFHFGDWLFYSLGNDTDGRSAVTDKYLIAQCFYAYSTSLVINAAGVLGLKEDEIHYQRLLENIKSAFLNEYVSRNGRLTSSTQTAYVLALEFDMLPEGLRQGAAKRLVDNIVSYNYHITTGFLGTPYICHVLSRFGYTDIAYRLLLQESYPSWLYPVKMGATTIWERWDGIKPDSTFQSAGMNSFNHYAYGAIGDWMYRVVCGIETEQAGYKQSMIQPRLTDSLQYAMASTITPYGKIASGWKKENGATWYEIEIPANTRATVVLPASDAAKVTLDDAPVTAQKDITILAPSSGKVSVSIGSGTYKFKVLEMN